MLGDAHFSADRTAAIQATLARLREQSQLANSPAMLEMLRFIVETSLAGDADNLKAYTIATQALGRPTTFDPQADPIVRVTATRLRRALEAYAQGPGKSDPVTIVLDRGSYAPQFIWREAGQPTQPASQMVRDEAALSQDAPSASMGASRRFTPLAISTVCGLALFAAGALYFLLVQKPPRPGQAPNVSASAAPDAPRSVGTPIVVPELRPTLIVGAIEYSNADAVTEAVSRQLRAKFISELRPFDDIIDVKDDPAYVRAPDRQTPSEMTYLITGNVGRRFENVVMTTNIVHLATGLSVYTTTYDEPRDKDPDFSRMTQLISGYAVHVAQPYGIISSNVWRRLRNTPDQQSTYICQLRVFNYWQLPSRESFEQAINCIHKRQLQEPESAAVLTNMTFLYVEAIRARYPLQDPELASQAQILDRALKIANRAVMAEPDSARTHSAMGAAYMINRNFPAAISAAREAIRLNPRDPELQADLGAKLVQAGTYKEALTLLNPVIAQTGMQPPWRVTFAALANYMLDDKQEMTKYAGLLKKEDGLLVTIIQLLDAITMKNEPDIQNAKTVLAALAPGGHSQIMSALGDRIYNVDILNRISKDIAPVLSN